MKTGAATAVRAQKTATLINLFLITNLDLVILGVCYLFLLWSMPLSGVPVGRRISLKIFLLCLPGKTGLELVIFSISYEEVEKEL